MHFKKSNGSNHFLKFTFQTFFWRLTCKIETLLYNQKKINDHIYREKESNATHPKKQTSGPINGKWCSLWVITTLLSTATIVLLLQLHSYIDVKQRVLFII